MRRLLSAGILAGLTAVRAQAAHAAEPDAAFEPGFGYVYTAEIEDPGETELSLWATDRRGKSDGHYDAQDYRLEIEHGITHRVQASLYADFAGHHIHRLDGEFEPVHQNFAFQGLEAEFKYQLLNPDHDGIGLAFAAEPAWSRIQKVTGEKGRELEVELKTIVQKEFLKGRLVWAANATLEPEWERENEKAVPGPIGHSSKTELAFELSTGMAYHLAPAWWLGIEGRYHSVYPDWTHGLHRENYAVYAGPTIRYGAGEWSISATWLPQLFGGPGKPGSSLELDDHEARELRLKISRQL